MLGARLRIGRDRSAFGMLGALTGFLVLLAPYAAPAATSTPTPTPRATPGPAKKPPSSTFDQEWKDLVAAAQREGKLVVVGAPPWQREENFRPLLRAFEEEFGIKIELGRGRGSQQAERVVTERRGGLYNVDVALGGFNTYDRYLVPAAALEPIKRLLFHPKVVDKSLWHGGVHRYLYGGESVFIIGARAAPAGISINTNLVRPGEIKSHMDLLDPKWKGKIVSYHPRDMGLSTLGVMLADEDLGPEFIRRIFSEAKMHYVTTRREFADGLALGAYAIGFQEEGAQRDIRVLADEGEPVKMLMGGTDIKMKVPGASPGGALLGALSRPPHPNAQKLFVNWLLTPKAQLLFNRNRARDYQSFRADVPNNDVLPEFRLPENFYIQEADPELPKKIEAARVFMKQLFKKLGL